MKGFDYPLLLIVIGLCLLGVVIVYSGASNIAMSQGIEAANQFLMRHVKYLGLGFVLLFFGSLLDHSVWKKCSYICIGVGILLLLLVFIMGKNVNGAQRWLSIAGVQIQPSEIVKFTVAVWVAAKFSVMKFPIQDWKDFTQKICQNLCLVAVIGFFLFKQPNYSMLMIICIACGCVMVATEIPWRYLLGCFAVFSVVLLGIGFLQSYRIKRFISFLNPDENARDGAYQVISMITAIGNGGIFGRGLGKGTQKLGFVPEVNTDGVFALIGEELGYCGTVAVFLAFGFLFYRGILIAERSRSNFAKYLSICIVAFLAMNMLVHVAVCLGCFPTTGQPLPFISMGGSNLCVNLFMIGVLLNISRENTGKSLSFSGVNSKYSAQKARYHGG